MTSGGKPWFLILSPADANQPGSEWKREGAASKGKISVRPIAAEGWAALGIFVSIWTMVPLVVVAFAFVRESISIMTAVIATIVFEIAMIGAFILLVWAKSTRMKV
jgi:hypothetical protein